MTVKQLDWSFPAASGNTGEWAQLVKWLRNIAVLFCQIIIWILFVLQLLSSTVICLNHRQQLLRMEICNPLVPELYSCSEAQQTGIKIVAA
jgi:hypothetical protein